MGGRMWWPSPRPQQQRLSRSAGPASFLCPSRMCIATMPKSTGHGMGQQGCLWAGLAAALGGWCRGSLRDADARIARP